MNKKIWLFLLCSITSCRTFQGSPSDQKAEFAPDGVPINWGSLQPMSTTPLSVEARLANAAAKRLNSAAQLKTLLEGTPADFEVLDGIVSVPIKLLSNDDDGHNHPFGDGQKNASVGWEGWSGQNVEPPLTLTLAKARTSSKEFELMVVEPSVKMIESILGSSLSEISGELSNDQNDKFVFKLKKDSSKDVFRSVIALGQTLGSMASTPAYPSSLAEGPAWLTALSNPWGWPKVRVRFFAAINSSNNKFWPVLFRFPSQSIDQAHSSLPAGQNAFASSGRPISVPPYTSATSATSSENLKSWFDSQPASAKLADFYPAVGGSGVHNHFSNSTGQKVPTATGGVDTYVIKDKVGNTQILYTCFDARNQQAEAQWGVPSGAGWHSIGHELHGQSTDNWTFAETVLNSFETAGIFAGWGVRTPYPFAEATPYDAKDVVTFRVLRANESYTTAKGHFHWYAVDASQKICTVIWKHLGCGLKSDQELTCNP